MNYKLCKQLKDAGFPQQDWVGNFLDEDENPKRNFVFRPSLKQLIEACGRQFFGLFKCDAHMGDPCWKAEAYRGVTKDMLMTVSADTPEEVVSLLWIKLNEKTPETTK